MAAQVEVEPGDRGGQLVGGGPELRSVQRADPLQPGGDGGEVGVERGVLGLQPAHLRRELGGGGQHQRPELGVLGDVVVVQCPENTAHHPTSARAARRSPARSARTWRAASGTTARIWSCMSRKPRTSLPAEGSVVVMPGSCARVLAVDWRARRRRAPSRPQVGRAHCDP